MDEIDWLSAVIALPLNTMASIKKTDQRSFEVVFVYIRSLADWNEIRYLVQVCVRNYMSRPNRILFASVMTMMFHMPLCRITDTN